MAATTDPDEATWKRRLAEGAAEMGVKLAASQADVLWRFGHMLREANAHMNLTSIESPEGILTLHMLDSLSVVSHLGDARSVIDVGTGGGFPGVPLAVAPEQQIVVALLIGGWYCHAAPHAHLAGSEQRSTGLRD